MNKLRSYDKLINKTHNLLFNLEQKIDLLPDVNISNLFSIIFRHNKSSVHIRELHCQLNQIKGKIKSALDTYTTTCIIQENIEMLSGIDDDLNTNQGYLLKLMYLSERIIFLEDKLSRKSVEDFIDNTSDIRVNSVNWDDLKIDI